MKNIFLFSLLSLLLVSASGAGDEFGLRDDLAIEIRDLSMMLVSEQLAAPECADQDALVKLLVWAYRTELRMRNIEAMQEKILRSVDSLRESVADPSPVTKEMIDDLAEGLRRSRLGRD